MTIQLCQKIRFKYSGDEPVQTLLGLVNDSPNSHFIYITTRRKTYRLARQCILSIEPTNTRFEETTEQEVHK